MSSPASPGNGKPLPVRPVLGLPVACLDYDGAVVQAMSWAGNRDRAYAVEAANTHVITLGRHERRFRTALANFDLLLPDGMPLVWSINRQLPVSGQLPDRVYGPTFMLKCLEATSSTGQSHFLLGGTPELLEVLQARLREQFPLVNIAAAYSPPFGKWPEDEDERIFQRIRESGANHVWVGLGCPKQEYWIGENIARLPAGVYYGIGAAFAFHAGRIKQAPAWMQARGLEWLHRVVTEPRRLFKRYAVYNSLFIYYSLLDRVFRRE